MNNENNSIEISNDVINTIITTAAKEVEGVVGIYNQVESNFTKIFKKKSIISGIESTISDDGSTIDIDASITILYGYELTPIGVSVQEKIKDAIENMTSYKAGTINVKIANVKEVVKEK